MAYSTASHAHHQVNSPARRGAAIVDQRPAHAALLQRRADMDASLDQQRLRGLSGIQLKSQPVVQREIGVGVGEDAQPRMMKWFYAYGIAHQRLKDRPGFRAHGLLVNEVLKWYDRDNKVFASEDDFINTLLAEPLLASLLTPETTEIGAEVADKPTEVADDTPVVEEDDGVADFTLSLEGKSWKRIALALLEDHGLEVAQRFADNYTPGANPTLPFAVLKQLKDDGVLGVQVVVGRRSAGGSNSTIYHFGFGSTRLGEWHVHWESGNKAGNPGWKQGRNGTKTATGDEMRELLGSLWGKDKNFGGGIYKLIPD